jgi:UDP-N-acetylmuramate: L-alanyl-gamma-D-glutamyl-meso-diaminopimelate ligase
MHIHIIGIAGTMTANLARELKNLGHKITGSDQDRVYPPISNILNDADIAINSTSITKDVDLAIIGSSYKSFERTRNEFEEVKKLKIPFISATQYLADTLGKPNSVLVAGAYGKTTITSLLSWIFVNANLKPNYMFGGESVNKLESTKINESDWSIFEADESIHGLDESAKFLYYPVKYLILTSADWEHKDCYKTEEENFNAFKKLIERLPQDGVLLINSSGYKTLELSQYSKAKVITYGTKNSDYFIKNFSVNENLTNLEVHTPKGDITVETQLLGQFNFENVLAAVALSDYLKLDINSFKKSIKSFLGIKRRIELLSNSKDILFFDDFAQSAPRVKSTLDALKLHYPDKKIKVYFLPHASFMQYKSSIVGLKAAFKNADEVVLGQLKFNPNIGKDQRATARDFMEEIGPKLKYLPLQEEVIRHYTDTLKPNDILVYMSSGGLEGHSIIKKLLTI